MYYTLRMGDKFKNWLKRCRKKLSWRFCAMVVAGTYVFFLLFSYFAVNPLAKKLVPYLAKNTLESVASVKEVKFDPFRLKTTILGFDLANRSGDELASLQKLVVDFELSGIFDLAWKFKQIELTGPKLNLAVAPGGKLNWDDLINKLNESPDQPPSDTIPSVKIEHIVIRQGHVHYADANRPTPIDTTLAPLNFQLNGFSTVPKDRGDYLISATFAEGGTLKWKGNMGVNPVASSGVIALDGIKIADALRLVKGLELPIKINEGVSRASFAYDFALPETVPTLRLSNLTFNLTGIAGELTNGGHIGLAHAGLNVPSLTLVQDQSLALQFDEVTLKLLDVEGRLDDGSAMLLKESVATLPKLDLTMQGGTTQLRFDDLNIKLSELALSHRNQLDITIPTTTINNIRLDLAQSKLDIQAIVLSNIGLGKLNNDQASTTADSAKPIATLQQLIVSGGEIALQDKKLSVQSILLAGLDTSVIRSGDGKLNWSVLFSPETAAAPQPVDANNDDNEAPVVSKDASAAVSQDKVEPPSWALNLPKIALERGNIHVQDDSAAKPVVLDVQDVAVEINDFSLGMAKALPVRTTFKVKQGGQFSAKGQIWPSPFKAALALRLSALSLKPFAPYLNQLALLKLNDGQANVSGQLNLTQKKEMALAFNGRFDVKRLAVVEEDDNKPFLSWSRLGSDNLKVSLVPDKLKIGTLKIDQPTAKFIIYEDRTTNLSRILRSPAANDKSVSNAEATKPSSAPNKPDSVASENDNSLFNAAAQSIAAQKPSASPVVSLPADTTVTSKDLFPVSIDVIRVNDAKLEFADLSLTPQFGTNIHSLNGTINGLSSQAGHIAQVEMTGRVDEYGSAKINGSLQPLNATAFTDMKLDFTNLDMSKLTPYSGKFAGRYIDSGKLSVNLDYKIKQRQLVAENKFVINKIKLGKKVEGDNAADLPLDLAIAILEDSNGVIDLDLPITGSLDNPEFSFASIAWKAFKNIITKIVTAPFRALGKLFGGDGEDFDGVAFDAGSSEISPPELEKLVKVSEVLAKRQGLALAIVPSYSLAADTQAIQKERYRRQVMEEMGVDIAAGQKPGPIDLGNEEVQDAVDSLYNDLTNKGLLKRLVSEFKEPEEGHYEKAQAKLIGSIEVTEADLKTLARARGEAVKAVLTGNGVSADRLSVASTAEVKAEDAVVTTLTLDVKASPQSGDQGQAQQD